MESTSSEQEARRKFLNFSRRKLPFYVGHLVCVTIVSLPTVFYVFLPDHPAHLNVTNKTTATRDRLNLSVPTGANSSNVPGITLTCNSPLIADNHSGLCRPPCFWTTQTPLTQLVYYGVVAVGLWLALISTIVTVITWASIANLRKFPHVVRFHIIICCVLLAFAKMVPIRHGLEKTFCFSKFWNPTGQSSFTTVIQGATTQYFTLAHSFWAMCFVGNTYAVIVQEKRTVFRHPVKTHLIQSLFCWLAPALVVAGCLFFAPPGYIFLFADLLGAGPASMDVAYFAVTLPVQATLGISLCLLWCIVWYLRKARLDSRKRVIRAEEERVSMRRVERQFMSMAILILLIAGVVLSIQTIIMYRVRNNVHQAEMYFQCLQGSKDCESPKYHTVLPLISVVAPGFLCLIFFFLLLMNKDCRQIWTGCFGKCSATVAKLCLPVRKVPAERDRSRCSSTLTVLCDRKGSDLSAFNVIDRISKKKGSVFLPVNGGARVGVLTSSAFSLPDEMRHSNIAAPLVFSESPVKLRSVSAPSLFSVDQNRLAASSTATEVIDESSDDVDKARRATIGRAKVIERNAGSFRRETDDYSSQL